MKLVIEGETHDAIVVCDGCYVYIYTSCIGKKDGMNVSFSRRRDFIDGQSYRYVMEELELDEVFTADYLTEILHFEQGTDLP